MSTAMVNDRQRLLGLTDLTTKLNRRLAVSVGSAVCFAYFVGWKVDLAWLAAGTTVQIFLSPGLRRLATANLTLGLRRGLMWCAHAVSHSFVAAIAVLAALTGGQLGMLVGVLYLSCLSVLAIRDGRSLPAFIANIVPLAAAMMAMPVIAILLHLPIAAAAALAVITLMFLVNLLAVYRSRAQATQALKDARERAEAATAAKSAFVAMVSHELRTPISGILAGAAEQEKVATDRAGRANAALIGESARMMQRLLNDLLDLSKIEAGRLSTETIPFDLRRQLLEAVRFWGPEARRQGLRTRLIGTRQLPQWVEGDPTRIRQIVNNLFSNALKFTEEGSVTLRTSVSSLTPSSLALVVEVTDTGPGMDSAQVARLFQPFDQLSGSRARTHGGTGLGLNISRQLAELMEGELVAESAPGTGTTFRLSVPLRRAAPAPQEEDVEPEARRPLRVLVADDHHVNRQAFTLILQPVCEHVVTVENGQDALEALSSTPFDLVLMDLNMPVLGGLETTRRLRSGEGPNRHTVVIALTASGSNEDVKACRAAGMDSLLMKPIGARDLLGAIATAFSEPRAPLAARATTAA